MPLPAGARIGPYDIVEPIGAGGMGEVYRGRDARLNRDAAIKILPALFAADRERLARFDREAQVLASLNHPNIAQIYGIEEAPPLRALVMELVEGQDLSEVIRRGPLPLSDAVAIARQIADGLACAHEQGIVHRDLKPANVKVREDGAVKVLDFGLARLVDPAAGSSASAEMSPTITSPATQLGVILGTAAYMAPEQARGKAVDKRADVWAFGVVLFEMLTSRRAFEGNEISDTLAFILTRDPDWSALPPGTPAAIHRLLRRCLQKDPRQRLADMGDARLDLDEALLPGVGVELERAPAVRSRRRVLLTMTAALGGALLGGSAVWVFGTPPARVQPVRRFILPLGEMAFTNAGRHLLAISPDGRRVAFVASRRLHVREIDSFETKTIAGSEATGAVVNPTFSPDGEHVAFYSDGSLKQVAVSGGPPRTLALIQSPYGIHWDRRGIYVGLGSGGIVRVPPDGGKLETLLTVSTGESAQGPRPLPNGDWILFTLASGAAETRWDTAKVMAYSPSTGERKVLVDGGSDGRYVPTGHLLYGISGILFSMQFDPVALTVGGAAATAVQGVARSNVTGASQFDVSRDGTLIYVPGPASNSVSERRIGVIDRAGITTPFDVPTGAYETPRVSPRTARRIAFSQVGDVTADVWIYELSGGSAMRRLTFGGRNRYPVWSPDERQLAFQSDREGDAGIFVQPADGSGAAVRLTRAEPGSFHVPDSWSPDGKWLLFTSVGATRQVNVLSTADRTIRPLTSVDANLLRSSGAFSPDGRWVAYYESPPIGDLQVVVEPFPATSARYQIGPGIHPAWSADGKEIFITPSSPDFVPFRVATSGGFTFRAGVRIPREATVGSNPTGVRNYDVMPDGKRLLVILGARSDSRQINVVLNWFEERIHP